jgi:hypothetical protein
MCDVRVGSFGAFLEDREIQKQCNNKLQDYWLLTTIYVTYMYVATYSLIL